MTNVKSGTLDGTSGANNTKSGMKEGSFGTKDVKSVTQDGVFAPNDPSFETHPPSDDPKEGWFVAKEIRKRAKRVLFMGRETFWDDFLTEETPSSRQCSI